MWADWPVKRSPQTPHSYLAFPPVLPITQANIMTGSVDCLKFLASIGGDLLDAGPITEVEEAKAEVEEAEAEAEAEEAEVEAEEEAEALGCLPRYDCIVKFCPVEPKVRFL